MCGIAGINQALIEVCDASNVLEKMGHVIRHRGPDSGDSYLDGYIGLRHQRLSIIDTSENGSQPMISTSGRFVIVFNGEIYNFKELKSELLQQGLIFRGGSDTEVLLALYELEGANCLHRLNGMFAIAVWDKQEKSLFLARDRLGKKPLYIWQMGSKLAFASEIKALLEVPGIERKICFEALKDYFTYQYIPDPKSIFQNIRKLEPGYWAKMHSDGRLVTKQWWNVSFRQQDPRSETETSEELYALIDDSVKIRMISDVPLGAFLSGGVDSSAVVGLMAENSNKPVVSCSIGFDAKEYDESEYANRVSKLFGTDHKLHMVSSDDENQLVNIAASFDEPFADPSFLPTYLVARSARKDVTVALAGDGGDESFAGYSKYGQYARERQFNSAIRSNPLNAVAKRTSEYFDNSTVNILQRGGNFLRSISATDDYGFFLCNSFFSNNLWNRMVAGDLKKHTENYHSSSVMCDHFNSADSDDPLSRALYADLKTYLPGDILVKVDRMSMANSLECRAPLLDYRIVEFAASIPITLKLKNGVSKYILKKSLEGLLPHGILHRNKQGFNSPISNWLRHGLKPVFERYVFSPNAATREYFDVKVVESIWRDHLSGKDNYVSELWSILVFELWWHRYILQ